MDGIESIGMPPMWPQIEDAAPVPYGVSASSRRTAESGRELPAVDAVSAVEGSEDKKKQVAKDFESVLLTKLFDQVQQSIGDWGFEDEDGTSKQMHGLFWMYLARDVADRGGIGLWKDIYQHVRQMENIGGLASLDEEL